MVLLGTRAMPGHHTVHIRLRARLSIPTAFTCGRPQDRALSREGSTCLAEPQSWGGQTASGPKQGTSDRSQTTEDRKKAKGAGPPLAHRRDSIGQ